MTATGAGPHAALAVQCHHLPASCRCGGCGGQAAAAAEALTTEHFTLQTARSAAIADSNGRSALFLSTVSSAVVGSAEPSSCSLGLTAGPGPAGHPHLPASGPDRR